MKLICSAILDEHTETVRFGLVWLHAPIPSRNVEKKHPLDGAARPWDLVTWANRKTSNGKTINILKSSSHSKPKDPKNKHPKSKHPRNILKLSNFTPSFAATFLLLSATRGPRFQAAHRSLSRSHTTSHARSKRVGTPRLEAESPGVWVHWVNPKGRLTAQEKIMG